MDSTLDVQGAATFQSSLSVAGQADIVGALNVDGAVDMDSTLDVQGAATFQSSLSVAGTFEVGTGSSTLYVGNGVVGINTETPSEAFEVVGNGKFSGTLEIATPTLSGHAVTKNYVDTALAELDGGTF
jgi:cytoskeletal protein CcmA (bactofilin family)